MSELAKGWVTSDLGTVALLEMGQSPLGEATNVVARGLPLVGGAADFKRGEIQPSRYTDQPTKVSLPGDIILCIRATIGKVAIGSDSYCLGRGVAGLRPAAIEQAFLRYLLVKDAQELDAAGTGTTFRQVDKATLSKWPVPLPPRSEQRRIVAKLDALTARTARARADLDRIPALAARYKQAVLAKAFSGELTADWRGETEFRQEEGALPYGWRSEELQSLASDQPRSIQSGPFGSNLRHSEFRPEGRLVIGIDNVQDGRFSLGSNHRISQSKFEELEKYRARPGDVAITVMATVGRTCVIPDDIEPAIITKHIYRITLNREVADPYFVMNALRGAQPVLAQMGANVRGQTRPGINGSILKTLMIPTAPLKEQKEIVRRIDRTFAEIDRMVSEATTARRLLDRLDQAVLAKAFRGELVPQDPADEPASVLLDRIRAERAAAPKARRGRKPALA